MISFVFDTNALIYAQKQGLSITPMRHHISVISELEVLSFANLTTTDEQNIQKMLSVFQNHTITTDIKRLTIELRRNHKLKLPDSIIVATAQSLGCNLITNDQQILNTFPETSKPFESIITTDL